VQFLLRITRYIGDTDNARTFIPMNTHTNPTPRSIFEDWVGKSSRLTKSPHAPRCRRERRLPLKAQTLLNFEKFAPTGSRTQDLRCYRDSCNIITRPQALSQILHTLSPLKSICLPVCLMCWRSAPVCTIAEPKAELLLPLLVDSDRK
jgi:hypothetical protein